MEDTDEQEAKRVAQLEKETIAPYLLFLCPLITLAALSWVYLAKADIDEGAAQSADYHRAPGCTPTGVASSGMPPCMLQTMTVVSKRVDEEAAEVAPDTYSLGLRSPGGAEQEVKLVGPDKANLFASVAVGGVVTAKIWQGDVLILTVPGWHCGTSIHPDAKLADGRNTLITGSVLAMLGSAGTFYGWRVRKKKQSPKSFEESNGCVMDKTV